MMSLRPGTLKIVKKLQDIVVGEDLGDLVDGMIFTMVKLIQIKMGTFQEEEFIKRVRVIQKICDDEMKKGQPS